MKGLILDLSGFAIDVRTSVGGCIGPEKGRGGRYVVEKKILEDSSSISMQLLTKDFSRLK